MSYLTSPQEIYALIAKCTKAKVLWIDTEVADFQTRHPQLSLIQILDNPQDMSGDSSYILDVLGQPELIGDFIQEIMVNPGIEKVFHNASYDLRFLGKNQAKNVTCTLAIAKQIPFYILPLPNYKLATLATILCNFHGIDKQEQGSDWGRRPLTEEQIEYAYLDCIYLAQVYLRLLAIHAQVNPDPRTEDVNLLAKRYLQLELQRKLVNSEFDHLQARLKEAMLRQNIPENTYCKLSTYERKATKAKFTDLVELVQNQGINLDFMITLTEKIQKDLGQDLAKLAVELDKTTSWRIIPQHQSDEA